MDHPLDSHQMSDPPELDHVLCPGCLGRLPASVETCPSCGDLLGCLPLVLHESAAVGPSGYLAGTWRSPNGAKSFVAVKVLDRAGCADSLGQAPSQRHHRLFDRLSHVRAPRLIGEYEHRGRLFLAFEKIEGKSLIQRLREGPLGQDEARRLLDDLLEILAPLHQHGMVQRHVRPDNIWLDPHGRAHLIDFTAVGLVGGSDEPLPAPSLGGPAGFLAPEEVRGELNPASDLYSAARVVQAALGASPADPVLRKLLASLTVTDWRRRPTASQAIAILKGVPRRKVSAWLAGAVFVAAAAAVAVVAVLTMSRPATIRPARKVTPIVAGMLDGGADPHAEAGTSDRTAGIEALLHRWAEAQVPNGFEAFAACYAPSFSVTVRSRSGLDETLDRSKWLFRSRERFDSPGLKITLSSVRIARQGNQKGRETAEVEVQYTEAQDPVSHTVKKHLALEQISGAFLITAEKILEDTYPEEVVLPKSGATDVCSPALDAGSATPPNEGNCEVSFEPGAKRWLAVAVDAVDVGCLRSRGHKAEVVDGRDFAALGDGLWVALGSDDDKRALAASVPVKARIIPGRLSADVVRTNLRWRNSVSASFPDSTAGCSTLTLNADARWIYGLCRVGRERSQFDYAEYQLLRWPLVEDSGRPSEPPDPRMDLTPLGGAAPVRLAGRNRHAYLVDSRGRWWNLSSGRLEPAPSLTPAADEGRVAVVGDWTYRLTDRVLTAERAGDWAFSIPIESVEGPWEIFAAGEHLVIWAGVAYVLEALPTLLPARLVKLCTTAIDGSEEGETFDTGSIGISLGDLSLNTPGNGEIYSWTSARGLLMPTVKTYGKFCLRYWSLSTSAQVVALFDGLTADMEVHVDCTFD